MNGDALNDSLWPKEFLKFFQNQEETLEMLNVMIDDFKKIEQYVKQEWNESCKQEGACWRRAAVRAAISIIECICYRMKLAAILFDNLSKPKFSQAQIALLKEESFELTKSGDIKKRKIYLESKSNLRFAFKMYAHALDSDFRLKVDDKGWQNYLKALEIRHRITHPKILSNLTVSKIDYKTMVEACNWFLDSYNKLLRKSKNPIWQLKFLVEELEPLPTQ